MDPRNDLDFIHDAFSIKSILALEERGEALYSKAYEVRKALKHADLSRVKPICERFDLELKRVEIVDALKLDLKHIKRVSAAICVDCPPDSPNAKHKSDVCRYLLDSQVKFRRLALAFARHARLIDAFSYEDYIIDQQNPAFSQAVLDLRRFAQFRILLHPGLKDKQTTRGCGSRRFRGRDCNCTPASK